MKYKSALVTAASGKVGGLVASHNKGGQYFRGKTIPTNPNTPAQQNARNGLKFGTSYFSTGMLASNRASFNTYAQNVSKVDTLGNTIQLSGQQWYVAQSSLRTLASRPQVVTCSSNFSLTPFTVPSGTVTAGGTSVLLSFNPSDEWATSSNGALLIFASKPQNAGVTYFKGPFTQIGTIAGGATATSGTARITLINPAGTAGSQVFFAANATAPDGRSATRVTFRSQV